MWMELGGLDGLEITKGVQEFDTSVNLPTQNKIYNINITHI